MHRYLEENKLGFTYQDILKYESKILSDLFDIFKQEIYQENKKQNSRCSSVKRLCYPRIKWS